MIITSRVRALGTGAMAVLAAALVACSGGGSSNGSAGGGAAGVAMSGTVMGGQQPISGAQVNAYEAGISGAAATKLACVLTTASGSFKFAATGSSGACPSALPTSFTALATTQVYLVATGGNPGLTSGTNNTGIALMAVLGPFSTIPSSSVAITELTTVAAVYPLAQMMGGSVTGTLASRLTNATSISATSPSGKLTWLNNSVATALSLVNVQTSGPGTGLPTCTSGSGNPVNCGAEEKLNTLADALAACVNTSASTSTACAQLFCASTPGGTFGTTCSVTALPTNTLQAALSVALNPGTVSSNGLFGLVTPSSPFQPALGSGPTDWTLALNFSGGGLTDPRYVAIDASGDAWVQNFGAAGLSEFGPNGAAISGTSGIGGANLSGPNDLAIDASGNIWVADGGLGKIVKLTTAGALLDATAIGGSNSPLLLAIDSNGDVWTTIPAQTQGSLTFGGTVGEVSNSDALLSPAAGYPVAIAGDYLPYGLAIDGSGNVWSSNALSPGFAGLNELAGSSAGPPGPGSQKSPNGTGTLGASSGVTGAGFTGGGLDGPLGLAIDDSGNIWAANVGNGTVSKFPASGSSAGAVNLAVGGLSSGGSEGIAIDGAGNAWVTNTGNSAVAELTNAGAALSPGQGFTGGGLATPVGIAIDSSGNVWVVNSNLGGTNNSLTEIIGAAVPVKTPLIGPPSSPL